MQERTLNKLKKRCLNTIRVLCRLVGNGKDDYFYVGYSSKAAYVDSPGRKGWNHVVVFADRLYCCDALNLEAAIHDSISHEQELLKKYHPKKKGKKSGRIVIRKSPGGRKPRGARLAARYTCFGDLLVFDEHALSAIGLRRLRAAAYELVAAGMNPGDVLVATGLRPRLTTGCDSK
jgi:hypothetical protein